MLNCHDIMKYFTVSLSMNLQSQHHCQRFTICVYSHLVYSLCNLCDSHKENLIEITVCIWIKTFVDNVQSLYASANKRLLIVHRNRRHTKQMLSKCTAQDYRAFFFFSLIPFTDFSHTKFLFPSYSVNMDFGEQTEMSARK